MKNKKSGHLKRNEKIALDCYRRYMSGQTEEEIGLYYKWKIQVVERGRRRCITAWRHIKDGEKAYERTGKLKERAFDIPFKPLIKVQRRKKTIDK